MVIMCALCTEVCCLSPYRYGVWIVAVLVPNLNVEFLVSAKQKDVFDMLLFFVHNACHFFRLKGLIYS